MNPAEPQRHELAERSGVDALLLEPAGKVEKKLEQQLRFEALIAELSVRFVNLTADHVDGAIEDCQRLFCESLGLDRSSLYQKFDQEPGALLLTHFFQRQGTIVPSPAMQRPADRKVHSNIYLVLANPDNPSPWSPLDVRVSFPWIYRELERGEPIIVVNMEELPEEAAKDREMFRKYGTQSTVIMPLSTGGIQLGCISFATLNETRKWSHLEVRRFRFIADLFANAFARKRADAALRESEEHLSMATESAGAGLWSLRLDTKGVWVTPRMRELMQFGPDEELTFEKFVKAVHPDDREMIKESARKAIEAGAEMEVEHRVLLPDGSIRWISGRGRHHFDATGKTSHLTGASVDITARKRAEEALKQSEIRFRTLVEHAGDGVEVVDEEGRHIDVNPARLGQLGYTRGEMLGLTIFDINPSLERERFQRERPLLAVAQPLVLETINRRKDGSMFPVEVTVSPIQVSGRRCDLALVRDISERKRGEAALRKNEERLQLLLEANSEGVWDWNIPSGTAYFSPRYSGMLGYEPEEFAKDYDAWKALVHPDDFERVHKAHGEHINEGKEFCVEFRMRKKNGEWCWIRSRGMVVERDAEGRAVRMVGTHLDITERKRTEQALIESSERLRLAAEATGFGAYAYDYEAHQGSYSPEYLALYGLPANGELELDPGGVPKAVHPDDKVAVLAALKEASDPCGTGLFDCEFRIKRNDDANVRWLRVRGKTAFTKAGLEGQPLRKHGIGQDITERKLAEQALLKSYAEIKQLKDRLQAESDYLKTEIKIIHAHGQIIGQSRGLKRVLHQTEQVAVADCPVLISGETGTGKELIAQEIHRLSARKERVMVLVNCAALPAALVESELFGRERGAYTGALTSQVGRFEMANGSTIFLDEVGELSMEVQAKLLRVLQQGEFQRLGSPKTYKVDVRVIAATNRDLAEDVRKGRFREDLYYRLKVFPIDIPPLRERAEDIPMLVFAFMEEFATRMGKKITKIPRKTMEVLQGHSWPGNIRELRNVIEHSLILTSGDTLKLTILGDAPTREAQPVTLAEAEREHILKTLESTGWRIKGPHGAAARLDLQPSTLYSRMQKLGIPHRRQKDEMATQG